MSTLKQYVIDHVEARDYWEYVFPPDNIENPVRWPVGGGEGQVHTPFRDTERKTPSFSINPQTGAWFDHGSQSAGHGVIGGDSILSFHAKLHDITVHEAAVEIYDLFVHPLIDKSTVRSWHRALMKNRESLRYAHFRGVTDEMIKYFKIGYDGSSIMFPVENEFGLYINARRYTPNAKKLGIPKVLNYKKKGDDRSYGTPATWFGMQNSIEARIKGEIFICEGEWDCVLLRQAGLSAVTSTGGAKTFPRQTLESFRGMDVYLVYDNDDAGKAGARKAQGFLRKIARSIRVIEVPKKYGSDVSDWMRGSKIMRTDKGWARVKLRATKKVENTAEYVERKSSDQIPLDQARSNQNIGRPMRVRAVIAGKATDPITLPVKYRITANNPAADDDFILNRLNKDHLDVELDPLSEEMMDLMVKNKSQVRKQLLTRKGIDPGSKAQPKVEVLEYANFEELRIQPSLDSGSSEHVTAAAYSMGLGLRANQVYIFQGTSWPSEHGSLTKLIFDKVKPAQTQTDSFVVTGDVKRRLEAFQPKSKSKVAITRELFKIAEWQSRNITKIRERPDLHIAVDLVYHSVSEFVFNGEYIHRGMLDVLLIGDTRCGKGQVAEGLQRWYGVGEVASGENCTFAGLVGGVQQIGKQWFVTWGIIPMNHNRMVIIDEASTLAESNGFARLSRVRSEGVAEITKIVRESSPAKTRLLWIANPISGRPIMAYASGVSAIKELIGANEDISRFDFALSVATDEVGAEVINEVRGVDEVSDSQRYSQRACRELVLWAWSRIKNQITFTTAATREVIQQAIVMGQTYSSNVPLIQSENVRIKISKIAVAIAGRTFSCDETGEILVVEKGHVQSAVQFLKLIYGKPSMCYDEFSRNYQEDTTMAKKSDVEKIFDQYEEGNPGNREILIRFLARYARFKADSLSDYVGGIDLARDIISELIKAKCVARSGTTDWYIRTKEFSQWIRTQRSRLPRG